MSPNKPIMNRPQLTGEIDGARIGWVIQREAELNDLRQMTVFETPLGAAVWHRFLNIGSQRWSEAHRLTRNHMHVIMGISI